MEKKRLEWHPGFVAALEIELKEDREHLQFEREYNLTKKPLAMDTLIIKMESNYEIKKSIGRIFRRYNVVEYKGPADYISVNDYYKVIAYACLLQADTQRVMEIPPEYITITLVANRYPVKLMKHLKERYGASVELKEEGIYYISGLMFPTQFVLVPKLTKDEYIWLSRLREDLDADDVECLSEAYVGNNRDPLYEAAMEIIIRGNERFYKEERDMCQAIRELFADEFDAQKREHEAQVQNVKKEGIAILIEACKELGITYEATLLKVVEKFNLSVGIAEGYMKNYWTERT